ncbi:MAG: peptidylprolyl isomerase [Bacteroidales bacterium]|nr:peptidylprolyl isomerase [Bacteroidales bacterium]
MNLFRNTNWCRPAILGLVILLAGTGSCDRSPATLVTISTDMGNMVVEVYPHMAPVTTSNFLNHLEKGTYTNSVFYRVLRMDNQPHNDVKIEVIQGGLYEDDIVDAIPPIIHETTRVSGILHTDGVISMARNEPGTASTEFFICIGDQPSLDFGGIRNPDGQGFATFGKVVKGMEVVRAIQALPDDGQYLVEQVTILGMSVIPTR